MPLNHDKNKYTGAFTSVKPERIIELAIQLFLGFVILFLVRYQTTGIVVNLLFLLAIAAQFILLKKPQKSIGFWFSLSLFFSYKLLTTYFQAANHLFIALYLSLAFLVFFITQQNAGILRKNIQLILGLALLFSGIQKIVSSDYYSGAYFYYMLQRGDFLWPLKHLSASFQEITSYNMMVLESSRSIYPGGATFEALKTPFSGAKTMSYYLSVVSIALELGAGIAILIKPKSLITHLLVLATIWGVFFTRQEAGFLTLLTVMGLVLTEKKYFVWSYLATGIVFLSLILLGVGFL
jgi:hypothetical protein